jgi:hypothetical protein
MFLLIFGKELKLRSWSLCRVERQNLWGLLFPGLWRRVFC